MNSLHNFISIIFILLYLVIGFIPNLNAVDRIAPQWLAMNFINILSLGYIYYNKSYYKDSTRFLFKSKISICYIVFISWAVLSYFYSINKVEYLVNISRQLNVFVMFIAMTIFIWKNKNKQHLFSWIIASVALIEIYYVINQAFEMINSTGSVLSAFLKGVTANRNITAFSLAIKIPFIFFLINSLNKNYLKIILSILLFFIFLGITFIQSRASYLATGFCITAFIIFLVYNYVFKDRGQIKKFTYTLILILAPLVLSILSNQKLLNSKGVDFISRASTITQVTTDDSITARIRYYSDVYEQFKSSPLFGVGLGNWKLKSIEYDKDDIKGYVVPYHAHSDFIQLAAELGIIAFCL